MRTVQIVIFLMFCLTGCVVLLFNMEHLKFYTYESPFSVFFACTGLAIGVIIGMVGDKMPEDKRIDGRMVFDPEL